MIGDRWDYFLNFSASFGFSTRCLDPSRPRQSSIFFFYYPYLTNICDTVFCTFLRPLSFFFLPIFLFFSFICVSLYPLVVFLVHLPCPTPQGPAQRQIWWSTATGRCGVNNEMARYAHVGFLIGAGRHLPGKNTSTCRKIAEARGSLTAARHHERGAKKAAGAMAQAARHPLGPG